MSEHPPPYGPPDPGQPLPPGWAPGYAAAYQGSLAHKGASTALALGIVSVVCLVLTPACCLTLPGAFCAPFAWYTGAKATREINQNPGLFSNAGAAVTGMWMGIVVTILGALTVLGFVALVIWLGYSDYSLV